MQRQFGGSYRKDLATQFVQFFKLSTHVSQKLEQDIQKGTF
jgi:hypothetical protein